MEELVEKYKKLIPFILIIVLILSIGFYFVYKNIQSNKISNIKTTKDIDSYTNTDDDEEDSDEDIIVEEEDEISTIEPNNIENPVLALFILCPNIIPINPETTAFAISKNTMNKNASIIPTIVVPYTSATGSSISFNI